jgi:hypothetical protein
VANLTSLFVLMAWALKPQPSICWCPKREYVVIIYRKVALAVQWFVFLFVGGGGRGRDIQYPYNFGRVVCNIADVFRGNEERDNHTNSPSRNIRICFRQIILYNIIYYNINISDVYIYIYIYIYIYFPLQMDVQPKHAADHWNKIVNNHWNRVALDGNP